MEDTTSVAMELPQGMLMPAEWEPHRACLILYPHNPQTFRLDQAQKAFLQVATTIATVGNEDVYLLTKTKDEAEHLRQICHANHRIHVGICESDDTWVRDTGPTCCFKGDDVIGLDWDFNCYGGPIEGCFWPCDLDQKIAQRICSKDILNIPCYKVPIILEGGSIHTDGEGTLLVTKECLLNPNRNPHLSQDEIENVLKMSLGVTKIIWLPHGLHADEDTNGHVDNFCCFTKPGHVLLAWTDDEKNDPENYSRCRIAESIILASKDSKGRSIKVQRLYLPPPLKYTKEEADSLAGSVDGNIVRQAGEKMAGSYVNFYISNSAVVVPQFGVETDEKAIATLRSIFHPDRSVIGVSSREILLGGGNIHCITQQVPASRS